MRRELGIRRETSAPEFEVGEGVAGEGAGGADTAGCRGRGIVVEGEALEHAADFYRVGAMVPCQRIAYSIDLIGFGKISAATAAPSVIDPDRRRTHRQRTDGDLTAQIRQADLVYVVAQCGAARVADRDLVQ